MANTGVDRTNQYLKALKKDGTFVAAGDKGAKSVDIVGLDPGTKVADGDYQVVYDQDNANKLSSNASDPADVPGFLAMSLPSPPTITATAGDSKVTGTYTDPADDGAPSSGSSDITKRHVEYSTDGKTWTTQDIDAAGNYEVDKLTNGTAYQFKATAENAVGISPDSAVVNATPFVAVTGVTLDHPTLSVGVGKTAKLTATVAPDNATDNAVAWSVADKTIATVGDDGTVTGVKVGTTDVTATSHADGKITAVSHATVTA
jgi:hypothetical protein